MPDFESADFKTYHYPRGVDDRTEERLGASCSRHEIFMEGLAGSLSKGATLR